MKQIACLLSATLFFLFGCSNSNSEVATYKADPSVKDNAGIGCGQFGYFNEKLQEVDGPKEIAKVGWSTAMTIDNQRNIFFSDGIYHTIREIKVDGKVVKIAGQSGEYGCNDGIKSEAHLFNPVGIAVDKNRTVYFYDHYMVRKVNLDGSVSTIAGVSGYSGIKDGRGKEARFISIDAKLAIGPDGNLYVGDKYAVRKVTSDGVVTTMAGIVNFEEDVPVVFGEANIYARRADKISVDGTAQSARFSYISSISVDKKNNIYVVDEDDKHNGVIRKISTNGEVKTFDENLKQISISSNKPSPDVPSTPIPVPFIDASISILPDDTRTYFVDALVIDGKDNIYVRNRSGIHKVDSTGRVNALSKTNIGIKNNSKEHLPGLGYFLTIDDEGSVYGFRPDYFPIIGIVKINPSGDLSLVLERASDKALNKTADKKQN